MIDVDLVVVGGGLAGIAAALDAADAGATVTLVERRQHLGGLTWSFRRHGLWFDNGQHVFMRCCDEYRRFLDRIGAACDVVLQEQLAVPVLAPNGRRATIGRSRLPAPLHLAGAMARYGHLSVADRLRLGPAVAALGRLDPDDPALDRITFGEWLARHHQRPRAVSALWDLITLPTVNVPAAEASLAMAAKVFRTGLLDTSDGGDIGWSAVPLGELHGRRSAAALGAAGVEVVCGARVEQLRPVPDGGWQVVADSGARRWQAASVVVAAPHEATAGLVPVGTLPDVQVLGTSAVVDVQLVFDRSVTDLPFFAAVDSPVQFVFDKTSTAGVTRGQCLALSLSGADRYLGTRPEVLVGQFVEALGRLLPGVPRAGLVDAVVTKEHAATFRATPGTAAARPAPGMIAPGLAVAGAWCATGWPATMEGAVRSGRAAAAAVLAGTGAAHPPSVPSSRPGSGSHMRDVAPGRPRRRHGQAHASQSGAGRVHAGQSGAGQSGAGQSDTSQSGASQSDTSQSDTSQSDAGRVQAGRAGSVSQNGGLAERRPVPSPQEVP